MMDNEMPCCRYKVDNEMPCCLRAQVGGAGKCAHKLLLLVAYVASEQ